MEMKSADTLRGFTILVLLAFAGSVCARAQHRLVEVDTSVELRDAIADAQEGDVIELAAGSYTPMGPSGQQYLLIHDPGVAFTVRAATAGTAFIDGGSTRRLMEFLIDTPALAGWVTFEGLVFRNGNTTTVGNSGGLTLRGARATFIDCVFEDNTATPNVGSGASSGAAQIVRQSDVQFLRCSFVNNTTDNHSGGLLVGQGSRVVIHDSYFEGNRSNLANHRTNSLGGAIHAFNSEVGTTTRLQITNTRFVDNEAGFVGGAIQGKGNFITTTQPLPAPTEILVVNSTFDGNRSNPFPGVVPASPTEGGAIMIEDNVDLVVRSSRFSSSQAGFGGAISSNRGSLEVYASEFRNNSATGRVSTSSKGRGGAINAHSNDPCGVGLNNRTSSVLIVDSYFESNSSQLGGAVYAVGDRNRMFTCPTGGYLENRAPLQITRSVFSSCSVDDTIGNHSQGGAVYGSLVDLVLSDSMILDSEAFGLDPSSSTSSSKGYGGGAAFLGASRVLIEDTVFAGNSADHEGGGLHLNGVDIQSFDGNTFLSNIVSPGGGRSEFQSLGAALYVGIDLAIPFEPTGAVKDSSFADQDGLAIYDHDTLCPSPCVENHVTYEGNQFSESSYGSKVFYNTRQPVPGVALTPSELNSLVVNRGNGSTTDKAPGLDNTDSSGWLPTGFLRAAPDQALTPTASGDPDQTSDTFLGWAWSGSCAELDGGALGASFGTQSANTGVHSLMVFDGPCSGSPDYDASATITLGPTPAVTLSASPTSISGGQSSDLTWNLFSGSHVGGLITHEALPELTMASGVVSVSPTETTTFHVVAVTEEGGATDSIQVLVDELPADEIFTDGFESGSTSAWGSP